MKPNIIPVDVHGITSDKINIHALNLIKTLQHHKFQAFVVGGAVRDLLLGKTPKDFDIVTDATPEEIVKVFKRAKIIGRRFKLVHVFTSNSSNTDYLEVSTFRKHILNNVDVDSHGRVLSDNHYGSKAEDSQRRDFTMNALYYDPTHEEIWDYHYGYLDIKDRVLRMIGKSVENRYREDPVRMLRALRLSAKLKVAIEPETLSPIRKLGSLLVNVPTARLFDEGLKILSSGDSANCVHYLEQHQLLRIVFPMIHHAKHDDYAHRFIYDFLRYVDENIRSDQNVSSEFMMAGICWHFVKEEWDDQLQQGVSYQQAMNFACNRIIDKYFQNWSIPLKMIPYIREVFEMQPRFILNDPNSHKINKSRVNKMMQIATGHFFRPSFEFFKIRAKFGEVSEVLASVWADYKQSPPHRRQEMQLQILQGQIIVDPTISFLQETKDAGAVKKRRRRKRRRKNTANANMLQQPDSNNNT